jgi:uncharacterized protein YggE
MKNIATVCIAIVSVVTSYAQTKNFIDQPYIDTTAKVDTLVVPDRIFVTIILQEEDTKGKVSIEQLESKMEKELKKNKVNIAEDVSVSDMASNFKKYFLKQKDILKRKSYSLLLHDSDTAAKVFIALEKAGISNVYLEKTEYSKLEELQLILKSKAIVKAKKQAEYLTNPLGQNVGNAIHIMDRNQNHTNYRAVQLEEFDIVGYGAKNENTPIEIEFEKIRIETTVSVKFELE